MKCQYCKNVEEVGPTCKVLTCEDCVEKFFSQITEPQQVEQEEVPKKSTKRKAKKKSGSAAKKYTLTCCKCKNVKATNYNIFKAKTQDKSITKYVCRDCK